MVQATLFVAFCSQYHIVSSKDIFFSEKFVTLSEEAQFIWENSDSSFGQKK